MKQCIAIFGAGGKTGHGWVKGLAGAGFRLLLMSDDHSELDSLIADINDSKPFAELEVFTCMLEGGWEADVIIINSEFIDDKEVANALKDVLTQKIVIRVAGLYNETSQDINLQNLQELLPNSKVVGVFIKSKFAFEYTTDQKGQMECYLIGIDIGAVAEVAELTKYLGCIPVNLVLTENAVYNDLFLHN
ncbi:MAG: hypothetical protein WC220_08985 [Pedobacter sp.]|jgi:predicted dinucleotide-binding enzyme